MALIRYPASGALPGVVSFDTDAELIRQLRRFIRQGRSAGGAWFTGTGEDGTMSAIWLPITSSVAFEFDDPASVDDVDADLALE